MKLYDCCMYFDEDLVLDLRFNILNDYVSKFVIAESKFSHSGKEKPLNFDINNFPKFKDKIQYLVIENEPNGINKNNDAKFTLVDGQQRITTTYMILHLMNKIYEDKQQRNEYFDQFIAGKLKKISTDGTKKLKLE